MGEMVRTLRPGIDPAQVFNSTTRQPANRLTFDTPGSGKIYVVEFEGAFQVSGGGGGSVAMYGPATAVGGYTISIDGGAPVRKTDMSDPVSGQLSNGLHSFRMIGTITGGNDNGAIGIEIGLNTQPGGATVALQPGAWMRAMLETENFE